MLLQRNMHNSLHEQFSPEPASAKLFIGGLSYDTTDASLARYFGQYGDVASASVLRDPVTSHSRGFGFVTFMDEESARRVLEVSRNHIVDGRKVEAKIAVPKSQTSPRKAVGNSMMGGMPYGGYGMGMPMNLGLGLNDPYGLPPSSGYGGVNFEMPRYNNYLNSNNDVYNSMQSFPHHDQGLGFDYAPPMGLEADMNETLNVNSACFSPKRENGSPVGKDLSMQGSPSLRRPTYPHLDSIPVSQNRLRKMSMPPSKLNAVHGAHDLTQVTDSLAAMDFGDNNEFCPEKILIAGLSLETTEDGLKSFFSSYGEVASVEIAKDMSSQMSKGYGHIIFKDLSVVNHVLESQHLQGNFVIDKKAISLKRFGHTVSVQDNGLLGQLGRSNSLHVSSREMFSGLDDYDELRDSSRSRIQMMRSHSIAQTMFTHRPLEEEDDLDDIGLTSNPNTLLKDDKMRSLSFTAAALAPLQRMQSESHRRGSMVTPGERNIYSSTEVNQYKSSDGFELLSEEYNN